MAKKESPEKRAKRKKLAADFAEELEKRKKPGFQRYGENHKNRREKYERESRKRIAAGRRSA